MSFLSRILALALASAAALNAAPNFVVINIDDLGYADTGPYGSKLNRTPNLDRMAAEGMKLTSHYASPVCTPSRASLMTGCYSKRALPVQHVLFPGAALGLNPDAVTVAEVLKTRGYATACVGKWHLGDQPEFLPTRQGFDSYFGIPYSNDMGPAKDGAKSDLGAPIPERKVVNSKGVDPAVFGGNDTGLKGAGQPPIPVLRDEVVIDRLTQEGQQTLTRRLTNEAVGFIEKSKEKPFFLYMPHVAVHFPLYPGKEFQGKSGNGLYGDWVEEVDWSVGQVLDIIRKLGLEKNTLVLFTSDNGGTHRGSNAPLRGNKGSTWEGGVRVPLLAWWPGMVPAGSTSNEVTGMIDILPTFAALADASLPNYKIDGGDISPILLGKAGAVSPHAERYLLFSGLSLEAIRSGPWKLFLQEPARTGRQKGKAATDDGPLPRLYHLGDDIGETKNVSAAHPEVVARLTALAQEAEADIGLKDVGPGCMKPGRVDKPQPWIDFDGTFRKLP